MALKGSRGRNKLTVAEVRKLSRVEGLHGDGAGLHLRVGPDGRSASWLFIYQLHGRRREMGLGSLNDDSGTLAKARDRAAQARILVADGIDPIEAKRSARAIPTFGAVADAWIKTKETKVRSDKSVARYRRAVGEGGYANALRTKRIDAITDHDVLNVIRPIAADRLTSARVLRTYLADIFYLAKAKRHRAGDNPAAPIGDLKAILEAPARAEQRHHAAMPWRDVPDFVAKLRQRSAPAARALEFLILTMARTTEVIEARAKEFDLSKATWTVPAARMKGGREHVAALPARAVSIIREAISGRDDLDAFVFGNGKKPLSNMAMAALMNRMGVERYTVHGFRSSGRDFAGDATDHPREIAEMALAHAAGDATEQAYRRGTALARRRRLMSDWAGWLDGTFKPIDHDPVAANDAEPQQAETPIAPDADAIAAALTDGRLSPELVAALTAALKGEAGATPAEPAQNKEPERVDDSALEPQPKRGRKAKDNPAQVGLF